ncbi:MAG: FAD binding domain-containing protein [Proteobacteria bacterium]|nr:FAD binding domain-containing protein [Pseudomonadota bacterium]MDA1355419.1 FAD binding domain-containing protein [Pseudomonadota bacterium]
MEFHQPTSLDAALALLAADPEALLLAGGATLVAMMNADLVAPSALISLRAVTELQTIEAAADGGLRIGAMLSHTALAAEARLTGGNAVVRDAAAQIAHPSVRNIGTLGGAVAHGDPSSDLPAALVAANAVIETAGPAGKREISAEDFFEDYLTTALQAGEMVAAVRLPAPPEGAMGHYEKFARVHGDYATLSVALVLAMEGGECSFARIALGAAGATPVRVAEAEACLIGAAMDSDAIEAAAAKLVEASDPVDDVRGSAEYRLMLVPRLLGRALSAARAKLESQS